MNLVIAWFHYRFRIREKTDEELWEETTFNPGLQDLLLKEVFLNLCAVSRIVKDN